MISRLLYCIVSIGTLVSVQTSICNQNNDSFIGEMKAYGAGLAIVGSLLYAYYHVFSYSIIASTKHILKDELSLFDSDDGELTFDSVQKLKQKIYFEHSTMWLYGSKKYLPLITYIEQIDNRILSLSICSVSIGLRSQAQFLSKKLKKIRAALKEDQSFKDELNILFSTL